MPSPMILPRLFARGGLAKLKGQRIQEILRTLKARQGDLSLDGLMDMPMPAARAFLAEFSGVGPKTIACVLLFACGHPAFPVDTHIHRVVTRLGLLPAGCTAERAHAVLEPLIPPSSGVCCACESHSAWADCVSVTPPRLPTLLPSHIVSVSTIIHTDGCCSRPCATLCRPVNARRCNARRLGEPG